MANTCKTCRHKDITKINRMLTNKFSLREIMSTFDGLFRAGLQRHKENCIPELFAEVREQKRQGLLADVDEVKQDIQDVKKKFSGNGLILVQLIGKRLNAIQEEAKLTGAYQKEQANNAEIDLIVTRYIARLESAGFTKNEIDTAVKDNFPQVITTTIQ